MANKTSRTQNHPKKGATIKVQPIRDPKAIQHIKKILTDKPRDLCLFTLGINTAYRANELLSIRVREVSHLQVGDGLEVKQSKVDQYRKVILNKKVTEAITALLASRDYQADDYLLYSQRAAVLTVEAVNHLGVVPGCWSERQ